MEVVTHIVLAWWTIFSLEYNNRSRMNSGYMCSTSLWCIFVTCKWRRDELSLSAECFHQQSRASHVKVVLRRRCPRFLDRFCLIQFLLSCFLRHGFRSSARATEVYVDNAQTPWTICCSYILTIIHVAFNYVQLYNI